MGWGMEGWGTGMTTGQEETFWDYGYVHYPNLWWYFHWFMHM